MTTPSRNKKESVMWNRGSVVLFLQELALIAAGYWIFRPVIHGGWLWDDDTDITQNAITKSAKGLWSIWFKPGSQLDYYPIKASVQWVQWHLWGMNTTWYHFTNITLHIVSAMLVWRLFDKLGLRLAWLGGLLFMIHPTAVESVAWIAELKNTLSMPPFLLAMCFYLDYDKNHRSRDYDLSLRLFLVAMLCKTTMVMFPVFIPLYAWWKRGRIGWNDLKDSAPFFVVSLILGMITLLVGIWYHESHPATPDEVPLGGFFSNMARAGLSLSFYFSKAVLPIGLLPIYPQWPVNPPTLVQFLPWPVMAGSLLWFWSKRATWGRHALLGFGFFLIMLGPLVSLNVGGFTSFTWVMDHFLYIPILGWIGLVVAGLGRIEEKLSPSLRLCCLGIVAVVVALLARGSHAYAGKFINEEALWSYTVQHNPGAWPARNNLGKVWTQQGKLAEAIEQFQETLRIHPKYAAAESNWGIALAQEKNYDAAIPHFEESMRLDPQYAAAHYNWGILLVLTGHYEEAIDHFKAAVRINPDYSMAYNNWGVALIKLGRRTEAREEFEKAVELDPTNESSRRNLAKLETPRATTGN